MGYSVVLIGLSVLGFLMAIFAEKEKELIRGACIPIALLLIAFVFMYASGGDYYGVFSLTLVSRTTSGVAILYGALIGVSVGILVKKLGKWVTRKAKQG